MEKPTPFAGLTVAPFPQTDPATHLDAAGRALAARGLDRGFVTSDDLLGALPEDDLTPEQIEQFLAHLEEFLDQEGIEVIAVPGEDADGDGHTTETRPPKEQELLKASTYDPVRMYLKEIGKVPLLTAAQEVDLAMRIEGGNSAAEVLASIERTDRVDPVGFRRTVEGVVRIRENQLDPSRKLRREGIGAETVSRRYRPASRTEIIEFLRRVERDLHVAKAKLIESNLRLVVSIARRYAYGGMMFLDLAQEGNLGLMRAVEKFDYMKGYKFSTYATWWIRQAITRAIADQARTIRIPVHMTEYMNKVARAQRDLIQRLGREPTPQEIGHHAGMTPGKVRHVLAMRREPISLESPVGDQGDSTVGDFIEDADAVVPLDAASHTLLQQQLEAVLYTLDDREKKVIQLRFGLPSGEPSTLEEVGRAFGVTRERIRQIESKTLCKLRHPSRSQQLRDYLE